MSRDTTETLRSTLRSEIGIIAWKELARFFASGTAIRIDAELNLVDVALRFAENNSAAVEQWMREEKVGRVSDMQAKAWFEADARVAAVVVNPWVLVQAVKTETDQDDTH